MRLNRSGPHTSLGLRAVLAVVLALAAAGLVGLTPQVVKDAHGDFVESREVPAVAPGQ